MHPTPSSGWLEPEPGPVSHFTIGHVFVKDKAVEQLPGGTLPAPGSFCLLQIKHMKRTIFLEIIVALFVVLFLYTAISKLMDYTIFVEQLKESPILGFAAVPVAIGLPLLEFALVAGLVMPRWRLRALYASTGLMAAFTLYIIVLMNVAEHLPCSCGGVLAQLSWSEHIVFNLVFIVLGILGILLHRKELHGGRAIPG